MYVYVIDWYVGCRWRNKCDQKILQHHERSCRLAAEQNINNHNYTGFYLLGKVYLK